VDGLLLDTKVTKENEASLKANLSTARRLSVVRLGQSLPAFRPGMLQNASARAAVARATLNGQTSNTSQRLMKARLAEAANFNKIADDLAKARDDRTARFATLPEGRKQATKPHLDVLVAAASAARQAGSLTDAENQSKVGKDAADSFDKAAAT
jgi:hypothetical protein